MERQSLSPMCKQALFAIKPDNPSIPKSIEDCSDIIEVIHYIIKNPEDEVVQNLKMQLQKASKEENEKLREHFKIAEIYFNGVYLATQLNIKRFSSHNLPALKLMQGLGLILEPGRSISAPLIRAESPTSYPLHSEPTVYFSPEKLGIEKEQIIISPIRTTVLPLMTTMMSPVSVATSSVRRLSFREEDECQVQLSPIKTVDELLKILVKEKSKISRILNELLLLDVNSAKIVVKLLSDRTFISLRDQIIKLGIGVDIDTTYNEIKKQNYPFLVFSQFGSKITFEERKFLDFKKKANVVKFPAKQLQSATSKEYTVLERQFEEQKREIERQKLEEEKQKAEQKKIEETRQLAEQKKKEDEKKQRQLEEQKREIERQKLEEQKFEEEKQRREEEILVKEHATIQKQIKILDKKRQDIEDEHENIATELDITLQSRQKLEMQLTELKAELESDRKFLAEFTEKDKFQTFILDEKLIQGYYDFLKFVKEVAKNIKELEIQIEELKKSEIILQGQFENCDKFTTEDEVKLVELRDKMKKIEEKITARKEQIEKKEKEERQVVEKRDEEVRQLAEQKKKEDEKKQRQLEEQKREIERQKLEEEKQRRLEEEKRQAEVKRKMEEQKRCEEKFKSPQPFTASTSMSSSLGYDIQSKELSTSTVLQSSFSVAQPVQEHSEYYNSLLQKCEIYSKCKEQLRGSTRIGKVRLETQIRDIMNFFNGSDFARQSERLLNKEEKELMQKQLLELEILQEIRILRR